VKISLFWKGFIFVLAAVVLVSGTLFVSQVRGGDAFSKEEASHALYAYWLLRDLKAQDWNAFWYDTQRQMVWPFLHSWVLAGSFYAVGVGYASARLLSLLFFALSVLLIYLICARFSEKDGPRIGVVAALLALTSPLMLRYAVLNLLETMGAFLFLAAAYAYLASEDKKLALSYLGFAVLMGLSIYTNYLYAYLLIPAFLVASFSKLGPILVGAVRLSRRGEQAALPFLWWAFRKLIVAVILLSFAAAWFSVSFSRKVMLLMTSIFKYSGGVAPADIWDALAYYPRVIVTDSSFSPWLGVFIMASLLLPLVGSRYRGLQRMYTYVWTVFLLLTLTVPAKAPQMVYIILPFIFIIFSAALSHFLDEMRGLGSNAVTRALIVLLLPVLVSLPRAYTMFFPARPGQNMVQVLEYFRQSLPPGASLAIPINLQHLSPELVLFHFRDWQAPVMAGEGVPDSEVFRKSDYQLTLELDQYGYYSHEVLDDTIFRWNTWLKEKEVKGEARLASLRRFDRIGLTAKIYHRIAPAR